LMQENDFREEPQVVFTHAAGFQAGAVVISALVQIFSMGRVRSWRRIDLRSEDRIPDSGRGLVFEA
jgi:hypothetical protein